MEWDDGTMGVTTAGMIAKTAEKTAGTADSEQNRTFTEPDDVACIATLTGYGRGSTERGPHLGVVPGQVR